MALLTDLRGAPPPIPTACRALRCFAVLCRLLERQHGLIVCLRVDSCWRDLKSRVGLPMVRDHGVLKRGGYGGATTAKQVSQCPLALKSQRLSGI